MTTQVNGRWRYPAWLRAIMLACGGLLVVSSAFVGTPGWVGWVERAGVALGPFLILEALFASCSITENAIRVRNGLGLTKEVQLSDIATIESSSDSTLTVVARDGSRVKVPRWLGDPDEIGSRLEATLHARGQSTENV